MLGKDFFLQQMDFSSSIIWQSPLTKSKSYWPKHLNNFENIQVHETTKSSFYTLKISPYLHWEYTLELITRTLQ